MTHTDPKKDFGIRKPSTHAIPPVAILHLGQAMACGEKKYGLMNWRKTGVESLVYYDAMLRHLLQWLDGENVDEESKCHPLAHIMACCAILLDAEAQGTIIDNRPQKGYCSDLISKLIINEDKEEESTKFFQGVFEEKTEGVRKFFRIPPKVTL